MQTSDNGRALIEAFEGCERKLPDGRYTTYHDSVGVLTLGYGHTNLGGVPPHIRPGDIWTKEQCDQALSNDLARFEAAVAKACPYLKEQYQFDALVSFDFNTGDLSKSSIPAKLKRGDISAAMATLLQYDHAAGERLPGLTRRRHAERLMFLGEIDAALQLAGAHVQAAQPMAKGAPKPTATGGDVIVGAYCDTIYGLGGSMLDPVGGMATINAKVGALRVHVPARPWNSDNADIEAIAKAIKSRPLDAPQFLIGDSCGANRIAWVAAAVYPRKIAGAYMIQPSEYCNFGCPPLGDNVERAFVIFSDWLHTGGLGVFKPPLAVMPKLTAQEIAAGDNLYDGKWRTGNNGKTLVRYQYVPAFHPDDNDVARVQNPIIADIKRTLAAKNGA